MASLNHAVLATLSGFVAERLGLHFPEARFTDLARGLASAGPQLGFTDADACAHWLLSQQPTQRQIETLASHLTVGETYFFRDPASFELLQQHILPPLIAHRMDAGRTLRLWSAGCCSGEEAYSLAITCMRALPDLKAWQVSVLATDINPKFLAKAEAGLYSQWSFRGAPDWLRERYFSAAPDKKLAIAPAVKSLVDFGYLNLAEDLYPSLANHTNAMDVILCRNVLMYFTPEHQRRVVAALHRCLVDDGVLLVNPAEASSWLFPMFQVEHLGDVVVYRKTSQPQPAAWSPSTLAPVPERVSPEPPPAPVLVEVEPAPAPRPVEAPVAVATVPVPSAAGLLAQARECANQGRLDEALGACQEALAIDRTDLTAHFLCATISDELGLFDHAIAAHGKVLYLDPDFILTHHALGRLYRRVGKARESGRHLDIALQLLARRGRDEIVPESDGMTCGRLIEAVRAMAGV